MAIAASSMCISGNSESIFSFSISFKNASSTTKSALLSFKIKATLSLGYSVESGEYAAPARSIPMMEAMYSKPRSSTIGYIFSFFAPRRRSREAIFALSLSSCA